MAELKFVLICKDGWVRSRISPHGGSRIGKFLLRTPKIQVSESGDPFVRLGYSKRKGSYSLQGRVYRYNYRLARSLFMAVHQGNLMIWFEGNPTPLDDRDEKWKSAMERTAFVVDNVLALDPPGKLMRPRRLDWALILVSAVAAFAIGFGVGGLVKK